MLNIHHVSFIIQDCARSQQFYQQIFGLSPAPNRPDLKFPGIWYQLGDLQLHLLQCDNPYSEAKLPEHGGRDRHLALETDEFELILSRLEKHKVVLTWSKSGRKAVFFRDPDSNVIELNSV